MRAQKRGQTRVRGWYHLPLKAVPPLERAMERAMERSMEAAMEGAIGGWRTELVKA